MFDYTYWGNSSFPANINMALEEFFVNLAAKEEIPSIRFFTFDKDSIVLSYGQATDAIKKLDSQVELTRRLTGGSHVHQGPNALSYMFAIPRDGSFKNLTDMRAYYAEIVANAFRNLGIENVEEDNRACGIKIDGKISAAHAMFWGIESALLHGIIILKPYDVGKIASRIWLKSRKIHGKIFTEETALKNIPAVMDRLKSFAPNANPQQKLKAVHEIVAKEILKEATRGKFKKEKIDEKIIARLNPLLQEKYNQKTWVEKRRPPFTEEEVEEIPGLYGNPLDGKLMRNLPYCLWIEVKNRDFKKMAERNENKI
jgi:lipoate-protein ligase A